MPYLSHLRPVGLKPGDVLTWQYFIWPWQKEQKREYHSNTVSNVTDKEITVVQGNLHNGKPQPVDSKTYKRTSEGLPDGPWDIKDVKAKRWNFQVFDSRSKGHN